MFVLNKGPELVSATLSVAGTEDALFFYRVVEEGLAETTSLSPKGRLAPSDRPQALELPAQSLTVLTAFDLKPDDPGIVRDE